MDRQKTWTEAEQDAVWEQAGEVDALEPEQFRKDAAGALMQRDAYGLRHRFGWEIDEGPEGLRPLFWKNAQARREPAGSRKFFRHQQALGLNVSHFFAEDV